MQEKEGRGLVSCESLNEIVKEVLAGVKFEESPAEDQEADMRICRSWGGGISKCKNCKSGVCLVSINLCWSL